MALGNFVVQNGLTVGPLTIDAATGSITTSGDVSITGNLGVSQISKNDSKVVINDTGTGSSIVFTIDGGVEHTMTGSLTTLNGNLLLNDVGYVQVPVGNTAQRPATPAAGMIRYNSTQSSFEGYGAAWASLGGVKSVDQLTYIQAETSPGASNDELEFFAANGASTTTRAAKIDQYATQLNGNLFISPATNGVNLAKSRATAMSLSDTVSFSAKTVNSFVQVSAHNPSNGTSASTDFIAYADTGDNTGGYIDMGIASSLFSDVSFGITKPGDGYIFLSAPKFANAAPTGGNLVLATADGTYSDIVFAAGGFADGTEQGRFVLDDGLLVEGNLISAGGAIYQGEGAKTLLASSNVSTTLSTTVNTTATTFTVSSTAGFLNHGKLQIENELMYYTGKSAGAFTGVTRGTSGTTAASHTGGAGVQIFQPIAGLTDASTVLTGNNDSFVQVALKNHNAGTSASTDIIAYTSNGDNNSGWIDMGITSETYNDATYGITGPDTGYIFMSAPQGTSGTGSLFLSTSQNGSRNDIVFTTGGFTAGNERVRIIGTDRAGALAGVVVNIATSATSTTTGALRVTGGVGLQGNLYVGGNFNLQGNITIGGTGSTTSTSTLVIENPISFLANANNGDAQDIGIVGQYKTASNVYAGVVRDSITKSFRFFDGLPTKPTTTVAFASSTAGNVYAGSLMLANTTVSSSTTSGALIVAGGVGIGGKAYIGGDVQIAGTITPSANLTYNLGSTSSWWGTLYGVSTQAKYADLAENYQADKAYSAGTVVMFGGDAEVTVADADTRAVAGVVSTNPAHLMNGGLTGTNVVPVALQGRAPCNIIGPVRKGDLMVSAGFGYAKASENPMVGQVIGKALCDFPSATKAVIEIVVGRN